MIAFVFPGQGAQSVGMGRGLAEAFPVCRRTFEEADAALGFALSEIIFDGPADRLTLTEITQPAILTVSVAACRLLEVYVDHALVHLDKRLWRQMMANALAFADTPLGAGYRELDRKLATQVGDLLEALQAKGRIARRVDCADAGQALFFICNQLFMEFVADDAMPRARMKERMFRQVKLVFDGLLP